MDVNAPSLGVTTAVTGRTQYQTVVTKGKHAILTDEPAAANGTDTAIDPLGLLMGSLASCTSITLRMYIDRKMWLVEQISVEVEMFKVAGGTEITRAITFKGDLNREQLTRLEQIADACPIHKLLVGSIKIKTTIT